MTRPDEVFGGRYRVTGLLGRGAMADVHRAVDEVLDRTVAIKVFRPGSDSQADRARFDTEVRTLAGLAHPHLVALYDGGQDAGHPWCVLQFVEGGTLADLLATRDDGLEPLTLARIGGEVADALAYIHSLGIIHRDIKPSNVLLDDEGQAFLSDFGVAQMVDAARLTKSGAMLGTAAYLSPEQVHGRVATPAVDVYALALVLLEGLTGRREFPGSPIESALARLVRGPRLPEWLDPGWVALLTAMTAPEPQDRLGATAVALELRAIARAGSAAASATADTTAEAGSPPETSTSHAQTPDHTVGPTAWAMPERWAVPERWLGPTPRPAAPLTSLRRYRTPVVAAAGALLAIVAAPRLPLFETPRAAQDARVASTARLTSPSVRSSPPVTRTPPRGHPDPAAAQPTAAPTVPSLVQAAGGGIRIRRVGPPPVVDVARRLTPTPSGGSRTPSPTPTASSPSPTPSASAGSSPPVPSPSTIPSGTTSPAASSSTSSTAPSASADSPGPAGPLVPSDASAPAGGPPTNSAANGSSDSSV